MRYEYWMSVSFDLNDPKTWTKQANPKSPDESMVVAELGAMVLETDGEVNEE